jgi:hypothetical protein
VLNQFLGYLPLKVGIFRYLSIVRRHHPVDHARELAGLASALEYVGHGVDEWMHLILVKGVEPVVHGTEGNGV